MTPEDRILFQHTLNAITTTDLREAAILWEDYFLPKYPTPFFLVRVADIRARLNSPATALTLYEEAKTHLDTSLVNDPAFGKFLESFHLVVSDWFEEQSV